jgi:ELWxxDGT repeat protein
MILKASALFFLSTATMVAGEASVELVKDIYPGPTSSNPIGLTRYEDEVGYKMYFAATTEGTGTELWVSDGTTEGTSLLRDIYSGLESSNPTDFTEFEGRLFFRALDGTHGSELWITDGTFEGTRLFADIYEGEEGSTPADFVVLGDQMLFSATTEATGKELWSTDGTFAGTVLVKDINVGVNGSDLLLRKEYQIGDDRLVFTANDGLNGESLWSTDGTTNGTFLLQDLSTGMEGETGIVIARPKDDDAPALYFAVGMELWLTDGTVNGTKVVQQDVNVGGPSRIAQYKINGKTFFFAGQKGQGGDNLWETDGTTAGTKVLFNSFTSSANLPVVGSNIYGLGFGPVVNDKISFITDNGVGAVNLWITDGSSAELMIPDSFDWVLDVKAQQNGEHALYLLQNAGVKELWVSNHKTDGAVRLYVFVNGTNDSIGQSTVLNDKEVLFEGLDENGIELWKMTFPDVIVTPVDKTTPTDAPVSSPSSPTPGSPTSDTPRPPTVQNTGSGAFRSLCVFALLATVTTSLSLV